MDQVTVVAEDLYFEKTEDTTNGFEGLHDIIITWVAQSPTSHEDLPVNTGVGLAGMITGMWKQATATLSIDPTTSGHHLGDSYPSTWGAVFKGTADLDITLPYIPPV
jgi:hypothetical protein